MWKSVLKTLLGVRVDIVLDTNRPFDSVQVKLSVRD